MPLYSGAAATVVRSSLLVLAHGGADLERRRRRPRGRGRRCRKRSRSGRSRCSGRGRRGRRGPAPSPGRSARSGSVGMETSVFSERTTFFDWIRSKASPADRGEGLGIGRMPPAPSGSAALPRPRIAIPQRRSFMNPTSPGRCTKPRSAPRPQSSPNWPPSPRPTSRVGYRSLAKDRLKPIMVPRSSAGKLALIRCRLPLNTPTRVGRLGPR